MQQYIELKATGEVVQGTVKLNKKSAIALLGLIVNNGNCKLHTEYGVFTIIETACIQQDILYMQNNKLCMHDAELSYFVLANSITWNNLLEVGEEDL